MPEFDPFLSVGRKKAIPKTIADNAQERITLKKEVRKASSRILPVSFMTGMG